MAKQMTADEESILKRQARRRLIGAIALTTAVVIILPIVFDGEPPATKVSDIELRIPDKDKSIDIPIGSAVSAMSAASAVVPASAPVSTSTSGALPAAAAAAIVAVPVVAAVASQHAQEGKTEKSKAEVVKPAQPEHKPEAKPVATHNAVPHSGFVVQVGAFANADAAKKLQDKLVAQGLHAYSEKVGHNVRVRVGSFATHEAADKIRHKIETQGLHPNVVSLGS
jgi:DedD protein